MAATTPEVLETNREVLDAVSKVVFHVGEETGQLDAMLLKVSDTYDIEVRNTIDRLLSVFTPVVTLFLAVLIGTIVLSVLLAILSVNDLVG